MARALHPFTALQPHVIASSIGSIIPENAHLEDFSFDATFRRMACAIRLFLPLTRYDEDGEPYEDGGEISSALIVLDVTTGAEIRRFAGVGKGLQVCALSPDGSVALSGGQDEPLRLWDVASGECRRTFPELEDAPSFCRFIADGQLFVVVVSAHLWLFDATQGTLLRSMALAAKMTVSPSGLFFLTSAHYPTDTVTVSHMVTGEVQGQFTVPHVSGQDRAWAVSDDGRVALVVSLHTFQPTAEIWDSVSGQCALALSGPIGFARHCALSPDGTLALIASDEGAHLWDVATGQCWLRLPEPECLPLRCAFCADGTQIALLSHDSKLFLYETSTLHPCHQHTALVAALAFSPDGQTLISASADHTVRIWDVATRQLRRLLIGHQACITAIAINPEGTLCASASGDQTLRIWDIKAGCCFRLLTGHTALVTACLFSPDGRSLVSAGYDGLLLRWDIATGRLEHSYLSATQRPLYASCAYSPEGRHIVASTSSAVSVWECDASLPQRTWSERDAGDVQWTPDGHALLLGMKRQIVTADRGAMVMTFAGMNVAPRMCVLSPDGTLVVAVNDVEKLVCVWDRVSGELLARWMAPVSLASCAIHPDQTLIVVGGWDGTVQWLRFGEAQ